MRVSSTLMIFKEHMKILGSIINTVVREYTILYFSMNRLCWFLRQMCSVSIGSQQSRDLSWNLEVSRNIYHTVPIRFQMQYWPTPDPTTLNQSCVKLAPNFNINHMHVSLLQWNLSRICNILADHCIMAMNLSLSFMNSLFFATLTTLPHKRQDFSSYSGHQFYTLAVETFNKNIENNTIQNNAL